MPCGLRPQICGHNSLQDAPGWIFWLAWNVWCTRVRKWPTMLTPKAVKRLLQNSCKKESGKYLTTKETRPKDDVSHKFPSVTRPPGKNVPFWTPRMLLMMVGEICWWNVNKRKFHYCMYFSILKRLWWLYCRWQSSDCFELREQPGAGSAGVHRLFLPGAY